MRFFDAIPLLFVLQACSGDVSATGTGDTDGGACDQGPTVVEPGVGEFELQLLSGGESISMVHGPQGGWHVDTAAMVRGTGDVIQIIPSLILTENDESIAGLEQIPETVALGAYDASACEGTVIAIRAYVDDVERDFPYSDFICMLHGREVEMTLTVTDVVSGEVGTGVATFTLLRDPADNALCN